MDVRDLSLSPNLACQLDRTHARKDPERSCLILAFLKRPIEITPGIKYPI